MLTRSVSGQRVMWMEWPAISPAGIRRSVDGATSHLKLVAQPPVAEQPAQEHVERLRVQPARGKLLRQPL